MGLEQVVVVDTGAAGTESEDCNGTGGKIESEDTLVAGDLRPEYGTVGVDLEPHCTPGWDGGEKDNYRHGTVRPVVVGQWV